MQGVIQDELVYGLFSGGNSPRFYGSDSSDLSFSVTDNKASNDIRLLQLKVKNVSDKPLGVNSLLVADFHLDNRSLDKILENGWGQSSFSGYVSPYKHTKRTRFFLKRDQNPLSFKEEFGYLSKSLVNEWYTQLVWGDKAVVVGAVTTKDQFTQVYVINEGNHLRVRITCQLDGLTLGKGEEIFSEKIAIISGGIDESLHKFAKLIAKHGNIKEPFTPPHGLCCAYYEQGNKVEERYVLEQLRALDRLPGKLDLDYIQIDAGYSPWGDWLDTKDKFPSGMEFIVKEIRKRGLKAGIWFAPFVAKPSSNLFKTHSDWFLKDDSGKDFEARFTTPFDSIPPLSFRVLDVTNPAVQSHISHVVEQFVKWGFDLIKTDFTYPVCFSTRYYKPMTRAQALRQGFEVIRKAAGKKVHIISAISQMSPLVGVVDSARVGLDTLNPSVSGIPVIGRIINDMMLTQDLRNCEARSFLNGHVWNNDADCLVTKYNSGLSPEMLDRHYQFLRSYGGSRWVGDNLNKLSWDKYENYLLDLFGFEPSKKPAVSVVIPAWNEEKTISDTMESLQQQQTKVPSEVVFVDNNCTDNTLGIVKNYLDKISNLSIVQQEKQGIGIARETGFSKAQSEIIISTDSDSTMPHNWISQIFSEYWKHNDLAGLVGTYVFKNKVVAFNLISKSIMVFGDCCHRLITGSFAFRGTNFSVKKKYWKQAGGFDTKVSALEDVDLSLRVAKLGWIKYQPNLTVVTSYRRFQGRLIRQLKDRTGAYIYRVFLKSAKKYRDWEAVR